jgi:WD40 repeat protein
MAGQETGLATFSPNGKKLAVMKNGILCIVERDKPVVELKADAVIGYHLSWSRDGKSLAAGGQGAALVFDVEARKVTFKPNVPYEIVSAVALSPDGKILATSGIKPKARHGIFLWDTTTGKKIGFFEGHKGQITCVAFSPDGTLLISAGRFEPVRVWDLVNQRQISVLEGPAKFCTFSPDGLFFAAWGARDSSTVQFWDVKTMQKKGELADCGGDVNGLAFSPNSKRVVTGGDAAALRIWDVATGKEMTEQKGHISGVFDVAFSPDGKVLASRGGDQTVRLWDWRKAEEVHRFALAGLPKFIRPSPGHFASQGLAFSPDGKFLAAKGGYDQDIGGPRQKHFVNIFDVAARKEHAVWHQQQWPARGLQFSPDSQLLGVASWGGLRLWAVPGGQERGLLAMPDPEARGGSFDWSLAFAPDGSFVASAASPGVRFWDPATNQSLGTLKTDDWGVHQVAFSPSGLMATSEGWWESGPSQRDVTMRVNLYETATRTKVATLLKTAPLNWLKDWTNGCMALSPDGRLIAHGGNEKLIRGWDTLTLKEVAKFEGHLGPVLSLAFAPDGKVLASGSMDSTILLWDTSGLAKLPPAAELAGKDLDRLWADLGARDAGAAYPALARLAAGRNQALPFLAKHLSPVPEPDGKRVGQLLDDLNDDKPAVRDQASKELAQLGGLVEPALRQRLADKPPVEVKQRLEALLQKLKDAPVPDDELRRLRAVWLLEYLGTPEAREVLTALAKGAAAARSTRAARDSLKRLAAPGK